jgi:phosphoglycerate kinase
MKSLTDLNLKNKIVLLRLNLNVPIKDGQVKDDFRIRAILPTLEYCASKAKKVLILAHLGRPEDIDEKYSLLPVSDYLAKLMGKQIVFVDDCIGDSVKEALANTPDKTILFLENVRFHSGEMENSESFGKQLIEFADVYINDAFGDSAKETASVMWPPVFLPHAAGFRMQEEVKKLSYLKDSPHEPVVIVIGGSKIKEKLGVIKELGKKADKILLGGGVANTFLKAKGIDVKESLVRDEELDLAAKLLKEFAYNIVLPVDGNVAAKLQGEYIQDTLRNVPVTQVQNDEAILDIGVQTFDLYEDILSNAATIFWAGPLGYIEWKQTAKHSIKIAQLMAGYSVDTYMGGGETASVLRMAGIQGNEIDFVSTGGGASLKLLSGERLPGVQVLS